MHLLLSIFQALLKEISTYWWNQSRNGWNYHIVNYVLSFKVIHCYNATADTSFTQKIMMIRMDVPTYTKEVGGIIIAIVLIWMDCI